MSEPMVRLDDLLFSQGFGTRRVCAGLVAAGQVRVAGQVLADPAAELDAEGLAFGRRVVVCDSQGEVRTAHLAAVRLEAREGLRGCDLVDEVKVDIEKAFPRLLVRVDDVAVPDLVVEGAWRVHARLYARGEGRLQAGAGAGEGDKGPCWRQALIG